MKARYLIFTLFTFFLSSHIFCQYDSIKPQGIYSSNFIIDEKPRDITYYMPLAYGKAEAYPLLIVLHDEKGSAKNIIKKYGDIIHAKADSANCIVLYPDALGGHWNDKGTETKDSVNDVGFISIMLEFFVRQFNCNVNDVYVMGIGTGGNLCYRFSCESIYKPAVVSTINATVNESSFSRCRNNKILPEENVKSEAFTKEDISKALRFLFSRRAPE